MVGCLLLVYVRADVFPYLTESQTDKLGVGMARLGNKGCVAFRFCMFGCSFVVVNSHLWAHRRHLAKRNRNYQDILSNVYFVDHGFETRKILDADLVIWAGDLNYR
jgi:hypothetical protein